MLLTFKFFTLLSQKLYKKKTSKWVWRAYIGVFVIKRTKQQVYLKWSSFGLDWLVVMKNFWTDKIKWMKNILACLHTISSCLTFNTDKTFAANLYAYLYLQPFFFSLPLSFYLSKTIFGIQQSYPQTHNKTTLMPKIFYKKKCVPP